MTASEYWTCFTSGIKNMLNSLLLMVLAFLFAKVNAAIGFTYYMIQIAESFMTPHFLPRQSQCSKIFSIYPCRYYNNTLTAK